MKDREGDEATEMLNEPGIHHGQFARLTSGETGLHITIDRRDLTWTKFLLQEGRQSQYRATIAGVTPLIAAAQIGFVEGVQALVEAGARLDVGNETGETPLISAVHRAQYRADRSAGCRPAPIPTGPIIRAHRARLCRPCRAYPAASSTRSSADEPDAESERTAPTGRF